ncbi:MAG: hypothetical protein ABR517_10155 [Thermoanaerobaculia bacterium]
MLAMGRRLLDEVLEGFLVQNARVDRSLVQFAEREKSGQRDTAVSRLEREVLQQREKECRRFLLELRVGVAAENRRPGTLDRVLKTERRFDHSRLRVAASKLGRDRFVQLDQILAADVSDLELFLSRITA